MVSAAHPDAAEKEINNNKSRRLRDASFIYHSICSFLFHFPDCDFARWCHSRVRYEPRRRGTNPIPTSGGLPRVTGTILRLKHKLSIGNQWWQWWTDPKNETRLVATLYSEENCKGVLAFVFYSPFGCSRLCDGPASKDLHISLAFNKAAATNATLQSSFDQ